MISLDKAVLQRMEERVAAGLVSTECFGNYNDAYYDVYPECRGESFEETITRAMMTPIDVE